MNHKTLELVDTTETPFLKTDISYRKTFYNHVNKNRKAKASSAARRKNLQFFVHFYGSNEMITFIHSLFIRLIRKHTCTHYFLLSDSGIDKNRFKLHDPV